MKKFIHLTCLAAFAAGAGVAHADDAGFSNVEARSTTLKFSRIEAQSPDGAQSLYRRLRAAADQVCSDGSFQRGLLRQETRDCVAAAMDRAVRDIDLATLTAIHYRGTPVEAGNAGVVASR